MGMVFFISFFVSFNSMYMTDGVVSIVCGIIAIIIIFYKLDNAKMEQVRTELAARRGDDK